MSKSSCETFDAVVVGGTLSGLITAYLLGRLGYRTVMVERSALIGGVITSHSTPVEILDTPKI